MMMILAMTAAAVGSIAAETLFGQLAQVRFINSGTVHATDAFVWGVTTSGRNGSATAANPKAGHVMYLEKYNVSAGSGAAAWAGPWSSLGSPSFPYLWQRNSSAMSQISPLPASSSSYGSGAALRSTPGGRTGPASTAAAGNCSLTALAHGVDMPGLTLHTPAHLRGVNSADACAANCCGYDGCGGFIYVDRADEPESYNCSMAGATTTGCCFLKPPKLPPYVASPIRSMVSGVVTGGIAPSPPLTHIMDPPSGMRSAVPLGGIGCGAVELRGDGSLHEW